MSVRFIRIQTVKIKYYVKCQRFNMGRCFDCRTHNLSVVFPCGSLVSGVDIGCPYIPDTACSYALEGSVAKHNRNGDGDWNKSGPDLACE